MLPSFGTVQIQHLQLSTYSIVSLRIQTQLHGREVAMIVGSETLPISSSKLRL